MTRPILIAHRGGLDRAPENTLEAFSLAIDSGVDGLELDVQLADDDVLTVRHDFLERGADPSAYPTLAEVLGMVAARRPDMWIVVDLKAVPWRDAEGRTGADLIDRAAPVLRAHPRPDRLVLGSFDWQALRHCQDALPGFTTAFHTLAAHWIEKLSEDQTGVRDTRDYLAWLERWRQAQGPGFEARSHLDLFRAAGGQIWSCQHRDLTVEAVAAARALGLSVWTWTVNTEADLRCVLALGVDAVTTDRPEEMMRLLQTYEVEAPHV